MFAVKKKICALLLTAAAAVSLSLSGCGADDNVVSSSKSEEAEDTEIEYINSDNVDFDDADSNNVNQQSSASKELIADPISASDFAVSSAADKSSKQYQILGKYVGTAKSDKYDGKGDQFDILEAYVDLLCDMNFEVEDCFEFEHKDYKSKSYALGYTGNATVKQDADWMFEEGKCDLCVYGILDGKSFEIRVNASSSLEPADFGYRYDGNNVKSELAGVSASAGLYRIGNAFETTDGRLKTTLGNAVIKLGEKEYTTESKYNHGYAWSGEAEHFNMDNYYRTDSLRFVVPYSYMISGDVYKHYDLQQFDEQKYDRDPGEYITDGPTFAVKSDGKWYYPLADESESAYEDAAVRVMYYEKDVLAVIYIYGKFKEEPYTLEALAAIDLTSEREGENADAGSSSSGSGGSSDSSSNREREPYRQDCLMCNGSGRCSKCGGSGYLYSSASKKYDRNCTSCNASGRCTYCNGSGKRS